MPDAIQPEAPATANAVVEKLKAVNTELTNTIKSTTSSLRRVLPVAGSYGLAVQRASNNRAFGACDHPEAEIFNVVPDPPTLDTLLTGTVPPSGGCMRIVADETGYDYVIELHLRVEVHKLYDLKVRDLSFSAQITVTLEWLVDDAMHDVHAAFWATYKPALRLPMSKSDRDVFAGIEPTSRVRQYSKANVRGLSQRMRHFSIAATNNHTFNNVVDVRNFPFDIQSLQIRFEAPAVTVWGRPFGVRLRPPLHEPHTINAEADLLPSNDLMFVYGVAGGFPRSPREVGGRFPERTAAVLVFVERDPTGILNNVVVPTALFQLLSLCVQWIDPCEFRFRLAANLTLLLTVAAKQVYIASLLPRVAFLTPPEKAVNKTIVILFIQGWLKVAASHLCFPRIKRPYLTSRDFAYEKKIRETSGENASGLDASIVDRCSEVLTVAVFLWCAWDILRCYLLRRRVRKELEDARLRRDDDYFRKFCLSSRDFRNDPLSDALTAGPKMTAVLADTSVASTHAATHPSVVFDVGTGETRALLFTFSRSYGVAVRELDRRPRFVDAMQEGGDALLAFFRWFEEVVEARIDLEWTAPDPSSPWAGSGVAWDGPVVAAVDAGSPADAAGIAVGWCAYSGESPPPRTPLDVAPEAPAADAENRRATRLRFMKVYGVTDARTSKRVGRWGTARHASVPQVCVSTGAWFRLARGRALDAAAAAIRALSEAHPTWTLQRLTDVDECAFECVAVRYAMATHPDMGDEPGGVVGVGQGSMRISLEWAGDGRDLLTPHVASLGMLEGSRTIAAGATVRSGLAKWAAVVDARLRNWMAEQDMLHASGEPRRASVAPGRQIIGISGCYHAARAAFNLAPGESPSRPFEAGVFVAALKAATAAALDRGGFGDDAAADPAAHADAIRDLANFTLVGRVFELLVPPEAKVRFARDWAVRGAAGAADAVRFRTTWSAGWFLNELNSRGVDAGVDALKNFTTPFSATEAARAVRRREAATQCAKANRNTSLVTPRGLPREGDA